MFENLKTRLERLDSLLDLPGALSVVNERISGLTKAIYKSLERPEPPPFVCVIAFAEMLEREHIPEPHGPNLMLENYRFGYRESEPRVVPVTLGVSGYIKQDRQTLPIDVHVLLRKL